MTTGAAGKGCTENSKQLSSVGSLLTDSQECPAGELIPPDRLGADPPGGAWHQARGGRGSSNIPTIFLNKEGSLAQIPEKNVQYRSL